MKLFLLAVVIFAVCLGLSGCGGYPVTPQTVESDNMLSDSPTQLAAGSDPVAEAKQILTHQVQYWTQSDGGRLPIYDTSAWFRLTYLSPQLIDAAVSYQGLLDGLSEAEVMSLRQEVARRLRTQDRIPFILTIRTDFRYDYADEEVYSLPLDLSSQMRFFSLRGQQVSPMEYDRIFEMGLGSGDRRGYVFFPPSTSEGIIFNIDDDASMTVRLDDIAFSPPSWITDSQWADEEPFDSVGWSFNLVPVDFPVEEVAERELPPERSLGVNDIVSLIDMVLTFIELASLIP